MTEVGSIMLRLKEPSLASVKNTPFLNVLEVFKPQSNVAKKDSFSLEKVGERQL